MDDVLSTFMHSYSLLNHTTCGKNNVGIEWTHNDESSDQTISSKPPLSITECFSTNKHYSKNAGKHSLFAWNLYIQEVKLSVL